MDFLLDPNLWIAFAMLTGLEVVLGIDNIIFISILGGRLPAEQRDAARRLGLGFAMVTRVMLLLSLSWVMGLTADLFTIAGQGISGRDLVLLLGTLGGERSGDGEQCRQRGQDAHGLASGESARDRGCLPKVALSRPWVKKLRTARLTPTAGTCTFTGYPHSTTPVERRMTNRTSAIALTGCQRVPV